VLREELAVFRHEPVAGLRRAASPLSEGPHRDRLSAVVFLDEAAPLSDEERDPATDASARDEAQVLDATIHAAVND